MTTEELVDFVRKRAAGRQVTDAEIRVVLSRGPDVDGYESYLPTRHLVLTIDLEQVSQ
jgi:hypothetical protein